MKPASRALTAVLIVCLAGPALSAEQPPSKPDAEAIPADAAAFSGFTEVKLFGGCRIPAIVVTDRATLLAFCERRNTSSDSGDNDVWCKRSTDGGKTWKLGGIVPGTYTGEKREDLTLRISYDECKTWEKCKVLHPGRDASYGDMTVLPDMSSGLLYETNATGWHLIWFARFTLDWLTEGKDRLETR